MAKNSMEAYGASGKSNVLFFDPESLTLVTDEKHPLYDRRVHSELSEEFIANIDFYGVHTPIDVRKNSETDEVEVVKGRQRVKAAREVNKRRKKRGEKPLLIPATVKRGDDKLMIGVMVSENEARMQNSPLERAHMAAHMQAHGSSEEDIARAFACSKATVGNLLALLEAPAAVRNAVESGKVTTSAAYKLARMPAAEAKKKLAEAVTQAPKTKGKRSGAGKKQMEIITGKKPSDGVRSRTELDALLAQVEESVKIPGEIRRCMVAVFNWAIGGEADELDLIIKEGIT